MSSPKPLVLPKSLDSTQKAALNVATELLAVARKRQSNAIFRAYHQEMLRDLDMKDAALKKKMERLLTAKQQIQELQNETRTKTKQKVPPKIPRRHGAHKVPAVPKG